MLWIGSNAGRLTSIVFPLTWTVNCEAPITVARIPLPVACCATGRPCSATWAKRLAASGRARSPNDGVSGANRYSETPPENVI
jgi:hypothetical protein